MENLSPVITVGQRLKWSGMKPVYVALSQLLTKKDKLQPTSLSDLLPSTVTPFTLGVVFNELESDADLNRGFKVTFPIEEEI